MTLLILENILYEIYDNRFDSYDITTGKNISTLNELTSFFRLPVDSVDAAMVWSNSAIYFFKADEYYLYVQGQVRNANMVAPGYPKKIADFWKGVFTQNIYACMRKENKAYFFSSDQYIRYDCLADCADSEYPKIISENWKNIPDEITGCVMLNDTYVLFQKNTDYYLYNFNTDTLVNNQCYSILEILKLYNQTITGNASSEPVTDDQTKGMNSEEVEMKTNALQFIKTLQPNNSTANLGGDSAGGKKIGNFPEWFGILQDLLTKSTVWTQDEESAQSLLYKYVEFYYQQNNKTMPPNVMIFMAFIGRGLANNAANRLLRGTHFAAELGASPSYQWCQAASSSAVNMSLQVAGYSLTTGTQYTDQWYKADPTNRIITGKAAWDATLEPGDMFSVVSNKTALSGHVMTCMEDNTDTILAVSGNAGGKAIRIEEVKRGTPPPSFNWGNFYDDSKPKQPGINQPIENGVVWIVSIQKTSMLNHLDETDADTLKQYGLIKK